MARETAGERTPMSYLRTLHESHKARLRRLAGAATAVPAGASPPRSKEAVASAANVPGRNSVTALSESVGSRHRHPTIFEIKALVAKNCGVPIAALESASRVMRYRVPRMIAAHLARRLTARTFAEIALRLGDRHHSTALHADRRARRLRRQDQVFDSKLHALERCLTEP